MFYERIGARFVEIDENHAVLLTPVVEDMLQPDGILHGGMSAYLAETTANNAAKHKAPEGVRVVGLELTSTHLLPVELWGYHSQRRHSCSTGRQDSGLEGRAVS